MNIKLPDFSLVLLIGASGSGKSTFAAKHFNPYEVISSDDCRGWMSNDVNDQTVTPEAFALLHHIVGKRLERKLLTVIDATNVQAASRKKLIALARAHHALPVALVFDLPQQVCEHRDANREDRQVGKRVIRRQRQQLKQGLRKLRREGFRQTHVFQEAEEVAAVVQIEREPLYSDRKEHKGPFDIIGDIHGCYDELLELLSRLGYSLKEAPEDGKNFGWEITHPEGRQIIFLGDLVDRGPNSPAVLKLVMSMVHQGQAWCVPGNHDIKLRKKLIGRKVQVKHGLAETLAQLEGESEAFKESVKAFIYSLTSHYVLDEGKLVVAHAGIKENMQGRGSGAVRAFCLYGETTGEIDAFGLPVRYNWAAEYRGKAKVVYGHTPIPEAQWLNRTINIDTGCVFGGKLSALRYPEEELVAVEAKQVYAEPIRPLKEEEQTSSALSQQQAYDDMLDMDDVSGKRVVQTALKNNISVREANAMAALEVMSRFAIHPKWLIYLPPTMSPCASSEEEGFLEHPLQAINYYKKRGIEQIICEEKHMGSRAVIVLCKDETTVRERFGLEQVGIGVCYTRTGRRFFKDQAMEQALLQRLKKALDASQFWERHQSDWVCLDVELLPWSAKAQALIREQYAAVGAAAGAALPKVVETLQQAKQTGLTDVEPLLERFEQQKRAIERYKTAYRNYCWEVNSLDDLKIAPFHVLATEGQVHQDKKHTWHLAEIDRMRAADSSFFQETKRLLVDTADADSVQKAVDWWLALTAKGGEGMVVKPLDFVAYGNKGLVQPAIKCRGRDYLRIIYGPDYTNHLNRLRKRGLSRKRSLALREFALSLESLQRFVKRTPLRQVHEPVFALLALESEPVDPRL